MRWGETTIWPDDRVLRQFAALLLFAGAALTIWLAWRGADSLPLLVIAGLALIAGGVGMVRLRWLAPVYIGWMVIAWPIAWIVSLATLAVVFYAVLTPVGLVLRLCGWDPLARRLDPQRDTYWEAKPPAPGPARYLRQF
jgi:hypothetical protein